MKLSRKELRQLIEGFTHTMGSATDHALNNVPTQLLNQLRNKISESPIKRVVSKFQNYVLEDPMGYEFSNKGIPSPYKARSLMPALRLDSDQEIGIHGNENYILLPSSLNDGSEHYLACVNSNYRGNWLRIYRSQFADIILIDDETASLFKQVAQLAMS